MLELVGARWSLHLLQPLDQHMVCGVTLLFGAATPRRKCSLLQRRSNQNQATPTGNVATPTKKMRAPMPVQPKPGHSNRQRCHSNQKNARSNAGPTKTRPLQPAITLPKRSRLPSLYRVRWSDSRSNFLHAMLCCEMMLMIKRCIRCRSSAT